MVGKSFHIAVPMFPRRNVVDELPFDVVPLLELFLLPPGRVLPTVLQTESDRLQVGKMFIFIN